MALPLQQPLYLLRNKRVMQRQQQSWWVATGPSPLLQLLPHHPCSTGLEWTVWGWVSTPNRPGPDVNRGVLNSVPGAMQVATAVSVAEA